MWCGGMQRPNCLSATQASPATAAASTPSDQAGADVAARAKHLASASPHTWRRSRFRSASLTAAAPARPPGGALPAAPSPAPSSPLPASSASASASEAQSTCQPSASRAWAAAASTMPRYRCAARPGHCPRDGLRPQRGWKALKCRWRVIMRPHTRPVSMRSTPGTVRRSLSKSMPW